MIILSFRIELTFEKKNNEILLPAHLPGFHKKTVNCFSSDSNQNSTPSTQRHLLSLEFINNSAECRQQNSYVGLPQLSTLQFSLTFNLPEMGKEEETQSRSSAFSSQLNESSPMFI